MSISRVRWAHCEGHHTLDSNDGEGQPVDSHGPGKNCCKTEGEKAESSFE